MGDWNRDTIDRGMHEGDELADGTVRQLVEESGPEAAVELLTKLIEQPRVPSGHPALDAYLAATSRPAAPLSDELLARSEEVFDTHGWVFFSLLGCASLPEGYVVPDISRVLGTTQQLEAHVHRRLWETIQFTLDVMSAGGLDEGGIGVASIQKVRLLHAVIRYLISNESIDGVGGFAQTLSDRTLTHEDHTPLNQTYLAGTILAFGFIPLRSLKRLGYEHLTEADEEAVLARWNVIGELMGVRPEMLTQSMDESKELLHAIRDPLMAVTDDGTKLASALVDFMEGQVPWWLFFLKPTPRMIIFDVCDEGIPEMLGIRLSRLESICAKPALAVMKWWARFQGRLVHGSPTIAAGMRLIFLSMSRNMLKKERGWERGQYEVPPKLLDGWMGSAD